MQPTSQGLCGAQLPHRSGDHGFSLKGGRLHYLGPRTVEELGIPKVHQGLPEALSRNVKDAIK